MNYSVYLVTDSNLVPEASFLRQVENAISGGVTMVQLREKSLSTLDFITRAKNVHKLTQKAHIPLIINDRVDIALAINAEGVHLGQDDMPAESARKLLGPKKIIGVTCSTPLEVLQVCKQNVATYVGLGTMYKTATKVTKTPIGPIGIRKMLHVLLQQKSTLKAVAIGGINHGNIANVMYQSQIPGRKLDGVAIVSCIMAADDSYKATKDFAYQLRLPFSCKIREIPSSKFLLVRAIKPLVHHITNNVVKNFCANVTLAMGGSPIMSEYVDEFDQLAATNPRLALVLNLGTPSENMMQVFISALQTYNKYGKHVIFDPVGAGASDARLRCCKTILNAGYISVIKGNAGEILAIRTLTSTYTQQETLLLMRGVDSTVKWNEEEIVSMALQVSDDFKCVVVVTGPLNYVVHNGSYDKIKGGNKLMTKVTGTGCALGSAIGCFVGAAGRNYDIVEAVYDAVDLYNKAAEPLPNRNPGTFKAKFIDELMEWE